MSKCAVRIVNVDFYMSQPVQDLDVMYADFRGSSVSQVPVIRIFGSTDSGKKICLHVHGVFPYLYIPYDGSADVNILKYQIAVNIDKAINISFGQASSTAQHVYKIMLVSGIPFYGYHTREHQFFKIFLFNPILVRKVANMLQSEVILGRLYQPHESHIPYILQFMIDYNLHGMSKILLSDVKFRDNSTNSPPKQSMCELEADTLCENILNRLEISEGNLGINPGIAALWEDEKQRLRDKGEDSEIGTCLTLVTSQTEPTKSHLLFKQALSEKLCLYEDAKDKIDDSISVYPAETPHNKTLKNASFIEVHSPLSSGSLNESADLNATLDDDAKDLFEILQDLGRKNLEEEETDCILSQVQKEDDEEENDFDLSMSMAETTPFKSIVESLQGNEFDDSLDVTSVPQLDGQNDGSDEENEGKGRSMQKKCKYGALPIFVSSPAVNGRVLEQAPDKNPPGVDQVKRKLNFRFANTTICESTTECQYKSTNKERIYNINPWNKKLKTQKPHSSETKLSLGPTQDDTVSSPSEDKTIEEFSSSGEPKSNTDDTPQANHEQSEEEIFEDQKNTVPTLTAAELYDIQTNYRPKEGCSSKFTQDSQNSDTKSSDLFPVLEQESAQSTPQDLDTTITPDLYPTPDSISQNSNTRENKTRRIITPVLRPPTRAEVVSSLDQLNIPHVRYQTPFYSDPADATGSIEVGHRVLKIPTKTIMDLEDCKTRYDGIDAYRKTKMPANMKWTRENVNKIKLSYCSENSRIIEPVKHPPTRKEVEDWLKRQREPRKSEVKEAKKERVIIPGSPEDDNSEMELTLTLSPCEGNSGKCESPVLGKSSRKRKKRDDSCRITGKSLDNTYGFKVTPENLQEAKAVNEYQYVTIFVVEVHVDTRAELRPDPAYDSVQAIFFSVEEDGPEKRSTSGLIGVKVRVAEVDGDILCVENEEELFKEFVKLVQKWDPDILAGYQTELLSWGFLLERSQVLGNDLLQALSRIKEKTRSYSDEGLKITGRILLDFWRLLRHEIALQSYTFENIMYHLLHKRVPSYSFKQLTAWWNHPLYRHRTMSYYLLRTQGLLQILDHLDLVGRTSELARLFGILFFEVLSRGSQFRVESMMLRLAKPLNYIPVSPSVQQRAKMKAPEFLPLILEPESKLYVDPVIVLDFQSLYPSMIIAYNYCFSTCLGKVARLGKNTPFEFGATQLKVSRKTAKKLLEEDCLNFSPCGVAYVKKKVRDGILPRMLREILETRLMVKNSMKKNKEDKILQKVLHSRQLGLKLIANVTYGYTAANFSGRMPAVELADSVVSKGRETLQRAIDLVETTPEWHARVVYGDTDSLFVLIAGRSRSEAFEIGKKIADAVTNANPDPVKLKLEKIYQPCILQTKKRYVGYMYESPEQAEPVYDAKGIETVRRDGCPAVAKMLEKCIRILFETMDVSLVKKYVLRQFHKILTGRVSLQDLTFAKAYRGAGGYRPGACVPALELARKWTAFDRRHEPRRGERVPYVIVSGPPGVPLIRLVRSPYDFLNDASLRPNSIYYITKVIIPPVNRCFNLIGADLTGWFNQMPRRHFQYLRNASPVKRNTISQYFQSNSCAACSAQTQKSLCDRCVRRPQRTAVVLHEKVRLWEEAFRGATLICESCTGVMDDFVCVSLDCPVLYRVSQTSRDLEQASYVREVISSFPELSF
ncbi:hypothetical protein Zmor_000501 [Zophobas morio]|uniref:DNA polymerase n=1 Tax=Zophobas morio TaxID=2755281 RepID=A0AA38MRS8_9CUCU|nr:hypothetical protein Zmor_000501 [Zophobas morio]